MGDHSPRHLDFQTKERAQGAVENNDNNNNNISKNNSNSVSVRGRNFSFVLGNLLVGM